MSPDFAKRALELKQMAVIEVPSVELLALIRAAQEITTSTYAISDTVWLGQVDRLRRAGEAFDKASKELRWCRAAAKNEADAGHPPNIAGAP